MIEGEKLFYTIGEVAQWLNVKPYVLRYWESEFVLLDPEKSVTGQRVYRKRDIQIALTIKRLLYDEKYTIAGAIEQLEKLKEKDKFDPFNTAMEELGGDAPKPPAANLEILPPDSQAKVEEFKKLLTSTKEILKKHNLS
jgi:DNA-binding transcriptional MerR regulator